MALEVFLVVVPDVYFLFSEREAGLNAHTDTVLHNNRSNLRSVRSNFLLSYISSSLPPLTDGTTATTQACLEEPTLTELNETCPLDSPSRELLIRHPDVDD